MHYFLSKCVKKLNIFRYFSTTTSPMNNPIVSVNGGKLRGVVDTLYDGSNFFSFKGIPYAGPPTGKYRFKAPPPLKPWTGVHDATEHGPVCPQLDMQTFEILEGDENCLYLNVYTRSLHSDSKLPVMVWFHGGGFASGSGNSDMYGPKFLLQHNVIIVTVNYRLGMLGFLCLDTQEYPGNAGLKDQVAALRWVQENIKNFGGNPDNVTLFGESAGGASVTYHLLSPMSKGLFHKAIAQSGACTADWALDRGSRDRAFRAGKLLGKETENAEELMEHLNGLNAVDLASISYKSSTKDERYRGLPLHFVPVVEKKFEGSDAFLDEEPQDILLSGKAHKVPMIIGYNSAEGLFLCSRNLKRHSFYNKNPSFLVPRDLASKLSEEKLLEFGNRIKHFYFGTDGIQPEDVQKMGDYLSDLHFVIAAHRFASLMAAGSECAYMYRFNCETELNVMKSLFGLSGYRGACHVDDLFYLFDSNLNRDLCSADENLRELVNMMTKLLTDFAKTGNPTPDDSLGVRWPPYSQPGCEYLSIEPTLSVRREADRDRVQLWRQLHRQAESEQGRPRSHL